MNPYINLHSGTEAIILRLKDILDQEGITAVVQEDFKTGKSEGANGSTSSTFRLQVMEEDVDRAVYILRKSIKRSKILEK